MRLICPNCQQSVTVPDTAAGQPTPCPNCTKTLTPPALTGAAIDAAPEPVATPRPVPTPPSSQNVPIKETTPVAYPTSSPGDPWMRLTLRRHAAHWLTPGALVVALVLTFFTWVAVAPNGNRIYTQNAWQAAGGGFSADLAGEAVMAKETELRDNSHWSAWLLFYVILLIPTTALAIADRVITQQGMMVPDLFLSVWPHRQLAIIVQCSVLLALLVAPLFLGFGLEAAVSAVADKTESQAVAGKPAPTTKEKAELAVQRDLVIARFGLRRTCWLELAVTAQVIALFGVGLARWLDNHPTLPDPRVEIYC
jgi:hypothetical protein